MLKTGIELRVGHNPPTRTMPAKSKTPRSGVETGDRPDKGERRAPERPGGVKPQGRPTPTGPALAKGKAPIVTKSMPAKPIPKGGDLVGCVDLEAKSLALVQVLVGNQQNGGPSDPEVYAQAVSTMDPPSASKPAGGAGAAVADVSPLEDEGPNEVAVSASALAAMTALVPATAALDGGKAAEGERPLEVHVASPVIVALDGIDETPNATPVFTVTAQASAEAQVATLTVAANGQTPAGAKAPAPPTAIQSVDSAHVAAAAQNAAAKQAQGKAPIAGPHGPTAAKATGAQGPPKPPGTAAATATAAAKGKTPVPQGDVAWIAKKELEAINKGLANPIPLDARVNLYGDKASWRDAGLTRKQAEAVAAYAAKVFKGPKEDPPASTIMVALAEPKTHKPVVYAAPSGVFVPNSPFPVGDPRATTAAYAVLRAFPALAAEDAMRFADAKEPGVTVQGSTGLTTLDTSLPVNRRMRALTVAITAMRSSGVLPRPVDKGEPVADAEWELVCTPVPVGLYPVMAHDGVVLMERPIVHSEIARPLDPGMIRKNPNTPPTDVFTSVNTAAFPLEPFARANGRNYPLHSCNHGPGCRDGLPRKTRVLVVPTRLEMLKWGRPGDFVLVPDVETGGSWQIARDTCGLLWYDHAFAVMTKTRSGSNLHEMQVWTSYARPGGCPYARVVDRYAGISDGETECTGYVLLQLTGEVPAEDKAAKYSTPFGERLWLPDDVYAAATTAVKYGGTRVDPIHGVVCRMPRNIDPAMSSVFGASIMAAVMLHGQVELTAAARVQGASAVASAVAGRQPVLTVDEAGIMPLLTASARDEGGRDEVAAAAYVADPVGQAGQKKAWVRAWGRRYAGRVAFATGGIAACLVGRTAWAVDGRRAFDFWAVWMLAAFAARGAFPPEWHAEWASAAVAGTVVVGAGELAVKACAQTVQRCAIWAAGKALKLAVRFAGHLARKATETVARLPLFAPPPPPSPVPEPPTWPQYLAQTAMAWHNGEEHATVMGTAMAVQGSMNMTYTQAAIFVALAVGLFAISKERRSLVAMGLLRAAFEGAATSALVFGVATGVRTYLHRGGCTGQNNLTTYARVVAPTVEETIKHLSPVAGFGIALSEIYAAWRGGAQDMVWQVISRLTFHTLTTCVPLPCALVLHTVWNWTQTPDIQMTLDGGIVHFLTDHVGQIVHRHERRLGDAVADAQRDNRIRAADGLMAAATGISYFYEVPMEEALALPIRDDCEITVTPEGHEYSLKARPPRAALVSITRRAPVVAEIADPKSVSNAVYALHKRHFRPRPAEAKDFDMHLAEQVCDAFIARIPTGPQGLVTETRASTDDVEQFLDRYPGKKKTMYMRHRQDHQEAMFQKRRREKMTATNVTLMLKVEAVKPSQDFVSKGYGKPRGIQFPKHPNVDVGREFFEAQDVLKKHVMNGETFSCPILGLKTASVFYGTSLTDAEKAQKIAELAEWGQIYATDVAAFDGSFHSRAARLVRRLYAKLLSRAAQKYHADCEMTKGEFLVSEAKRMFKAFSYRCGAQRRSGDWDTSSGNSVWNAIVQIVTFAKLGAEHIRVLVLGDDSVCAVRWPAGHPGNHTRVTDAEIVQAGLGLGMQLEPVEIADGDTPRWLRVDYCSSLIWYTGSDSSDEPTLVCLPKLHRAIAKWGYSPVHKLPLQVATERRAAAEDAMAKGAVCVPVLRLLYEPFVRNPAVPAGASYQKACKLNEALFIARYGLDAQQAEADCRRGATLWDPIPDRVYDALVHGETGTVLQEYPRAQTPEVENWHRTLLQAAVAMRNHEGYALEILRRGWLGCPPNQRPPRMIAHTVMHALAAAVDAGAPFGVDSKIEWLRQPTLQAFSRHWRANADPDWA